MPGVHAAFFEALQKAVSFGLLHQFSAVCGGAAAVLSKALLHQHAPFAEMNEPEIMPNS